MEIKEFKNRNKLKNKIDEYKIELDKYKQNNVYNLKDGGILAMEALFEWMDLVDEYNEKEC